MACFPGVRPGSGRWRSDSLAVEGMSEFVFVAKTEIEAEQLALGIAENNPARAGLNSEVRAIDLRGR